jgi:hypothetical protein
LELNNKVPNDDHTTFLAIDFGICEEGAIVPKLIEVQGFPSLYNYHIYEKFVNQYPFLSELTPSLMV